jgi:hypothetical protein
MNVSSVELGIVQNDLWPHNFHLNVFLPSGMDCIIAESFTAFLHSVFSAVYENLINLTCIFLYPPGGLHNEELHNLNTSPNVIRVIK